MGNTDEMDEKGEGIGVGHGMGSGGWVVGTTEQLVGEISDRSDHASVCCAVAGHV